MPQHIEISSLDLRYEMCRLKSPVAEKILLGSIVENGIRDPLQGVDAGERHILLDGFKRYRCAVKLGIGIIPYISLSNDEACGLIALLRVSNAKSLSILEQARFIDELKIVHQMTTAEIAGLLEKR
jgi:ParB-like chromosome segregation protein Spo0J